MSDLAPFLLMLLFWVFLGSRISKIKKNNNAKTGTVQKPQQETKRQPDPVNLPPDPVSAAPVRSPMSPSIPSPSLSEGLSGWDHSTYSVGSLGEDSLEGVDPCHDGQAEDMDRLRSVPSENPSSTVPGMTLSWAGNDVVRGFVYGEILNRRKSAS